MARTVAAWNPLQRSKYPFSDPVDLIVWIMSIPVTVAALRFAVSLDFVAVISRRILPSRFEMSRLITIVARPTAVRIRLYRAMMIR